MHDLLIGLSTALASAVEMVEALTIVLAVGVTRGWRSALLGVAGGLATLTVIVAALGPALTVVPIDGLRLVVGGLLLTFGLQWLRKAMLRASGFKALHDEDAIFRKETEELRAADRGGDVDWYSFTVAFKGVLLEGLEVAFIVITFGSAQHAVGVAAAGAGAAAVVVGIVGLIVHAPLSRVPENSMKFAVGVMLTSFGTFWGGEGAGVRWPGGDVALLVLIGFVTLASFGGIAALRQSRHGAHV
ncbi:MAG: COG4280 domain-containing protein [Acidimicrobiales bacterium]